MLMIMCKAFAVTFVMADAYTRSFWGLFGMDAVNIFTSLN